MESQAPYKHYKTYRHLPRHASYACKRKDVDACLEHLEISPPFDDLVFGDFWGIPEAARGGPVPPAMQVAEAREWFHADLHERWDFRRVTWSLRISIVPRSVIRTARTALQEEGLELLIRWLEARRQLPETARGHRFAFALDLVVADGTLRAREASAPPDSMKSI